MRYRIDLSKSRNGYARVNFPGRVLALEANRHVGPVWLVGISDFAVDVAGDMPGEALTDTPGNAERSVAVRADSAGEAVWRVARAAVRAVAEISGSPAPGTIPGMIPGTTTRNIASSGEG
jgi:hypothetical protein